MTAVIGLHLQNIHRVSPPVLHQKPATTFSHNLHLMMTVIAAPLTEAYRPLKSDDFSMFFENYDDFFIFRQNKRESGISA